ncbi:hypothetical protein LBMAG42_08720 [Deltaproteobacteria bacterium]|nr:hypothetical protein LBMAG42_08720 [Deltaproteobacteria bacterium]
MSHGPELPLDWEEGLFVLLSRLWRRVRPGKPALCRAEAVRLTDEAGALACLASVVAGEPIRLLEAGGVGGVRGPELLLPPTFDLGGTAAENRAALIVRIVTGATVRRLGLDDTSGPATVEAFRQASRLLHAELPGFAAVYSAAAALVRSARPDPADAPLLAALNLDVPWVPLTADRPALPLWGTILVPVGAALAGAGEQLPSRSTGIERRRAIDEAQRITLNEEKAREQVLIHSFEKVETLDEHRGQLRRMDGSDELDAHADALDEVDLRELLRGGEPAHSMLRAEIGIDAGVPDVSDVLPGETGQAYDEWDARAGAFKKAWCTVYPSRLREGDSAWLAAALARNRRVIDTLAERLSQHRARRRPRNRERDGDDIDLDALADERADRRAGRAPAERVYMRKARPERSFATTVLLDISLSTDAWMEDARVLDVARDAVLALGEVADRLGDDLQVLAFASHTRTRCRVWTLRDWNEPWSAARARLGSLRPQGYTRIGPALRHSTAQLVKHGADRRLLLLVSDGRPTDLDRYEGRHGMADVRHALAEARSKGVHTHVLAIDNGARDTLAACFGEGAWHIVPHPRALPEALGTVYGRLRG